MKTRILLLLALAGFAGFARAQNAPRDGAATPDVTAVPVPAQGELVPPANNPSSGPPNVVGGETPGGIPPFPSLPTRASRTNNARFRQGATNAADAPLTNRPSAIPRPLRRPDAVVPSTAPGLNNPNIPRPGGRNPGPNLGAKPSDPNKLSPEEEAANDDAVKKAKQREKGFLKIKGMPLEQFLDVYSGYADRTILRGQGLPQLNVTLDTKSELTPEEMLQAFDTLLALNGVSMIPTGTKFVTAVPNANQGDVPPPFANRATADYPEAAQYVTHVIQVKHVSIEEAVGVLKQFSKNQNGLVALESTKTIILRDFAINVKRMLEVLEKIDIEVEDDFQLEVIPIKYGKVEDIYSALTSVISGSGGVTGGAAAGRGGLGGAGGLGGRGLGGSTGLNGGVGSGLGGTGGNYNSSLNRGGVNGLANNRTGLGNGTGTGTGTGNSFQQRFNNINKNGALGGANGLAEILQSSSITADARSNSLIVYASKKDIARIKDVLSKVDTLLAQVLIEGIVMSVSVNDGFNFGLQAGQSPKQFTSNPNVVGAGSVNAGGPGLGSLSSLGTNALGAAFPAGSGFTYLTQIGHNWAANVNALSTDGRVDIIQRPRILTSHATPASFSVGKSVPFKQGDYTSGIGGTSSYYSQLFVGVQLQVTPYLTPDGLVTMDVSQTIQDLDNAGDPTTGVPPTTTERQATSTVSVMTGDTILLGGYINTTKSKSHSGVPFLQDIPLLGNVFKSHTKSTDRTELMVMLRPTIVKDPRDAAKLTGQQREASKDMRELERNLGQDAKPDRESDAGKVSDGKKSK